MSARQVAAFAAESSGMLFLSLVGLGAIGAVFSLAWLVGEPIAVAVTSRLSPMFRVSRRRSRRS